MARTAGSHSDITGPRIREVALRLFAQHGYAAVSMRQIARTVGVQAGALYNYTTDKQSLLFDLMRDHMEDILAVTVVDTTLPAMQQLEAFVRLHIQFNVERPDAVFISYMELRNLSEANFAVIERMRRSYETRLEDILRQGELDVPDPKVAALAIIAMLTGVNTWYRASGRLSLAEVEALYWDMVRKTVSA